MCRFAAPTGSLARGIGSILQEIIPNERKFEQTFKNMAPKRVQKEGLKSYILGLFEFWKHLVRSKTTRQEICANIEEHGSKEGPKSGPEITDSRAV